MRTIAIFKTIFGCIVECTLSPIIFAELRTAFALFDKNNDGHIERSEVMSVVKSLGMHMDEKEVMKMIRNADKDG